MKKRLPAAIVISVIAGLASVPGHANAGTNVSVNVGLPVAVVAPAPAVVAPQPVYMDEPAEMVVIPRSNVYFVPGVSVDIFFYDNRWWNRRGDRWYRASAHNGPWVAVGHKHVPGPVYRIPADYRTVYVHEKRVPYGQWKKGHYKGEKHGKRHKHHND